MSDKNCTSTLIKLVSVWASLITRLKTLKNTLGSPYKNAQRVAEKDKQLYNKHLSGKCTIFVANPNRSSVKKTDNYRVICLTHRDKILLYFLNMHVCFSVARENHFYLIIPTSWLAVYHDISLFDRFVCHDFRLFYRWLTTFPWLE